MFSPVSIVPGGYQSVTEAEKEAEITGSAAPDGRDACESAVEGPIFASTAFPVANCNRRRFPQLERMPRPSSSRQKRMLRSTSAS